MAIPVYLRPRSRASFLFDMGESHFESHLFVDLVTVVIAAFLGGVAARALRAPPVLGYLAMGMIIGPYVAGRTGDEWLHFATVADVDTVHTLAEIGVVLLVFAIGIEISFRELISLGKVIVVGGILQIAVTAALLTPFGLLLGFDITTAIILGMVGALSSTMVVLKTLTDRGEIHSLHGRLLTGFLLMQDLVFILMIAMLPALGDAGSGTGVLTEIGIGVLKTVVVIGGVAILGIKVMPFVMSRITVLGSREVFVLMVVALVFAISGLTNFVGLSAALGAFVAGLLLSESDIGHWALAEVAPLRDVFAALFFASLGMLTDPVFIVDNYAPVLAVIGSAVAIKLIVTALIVRVSGYLPSTALLTGIGLGQIGEFSFILVAGALALGVVEQSFHSLIVVSAVLTMAAGAAHDNRGDKAGLGAQPAVPGAAPIPHRRLSRRRAPPADVRARGYLRTWQGGITGGPGTAGTQRSLHGRRPGPAHAGRVAGQRVSHRPRLVRPGGSASSGASATGRAAGGYYGRSGVGRDDFLPRPATPAGA